MKYIYITIIGAILVFVGFLIFSSPAQSRKTDDAPVNNVTVVEGKQIVEITAKGGYTPRKSLAKAGLPTTLRVNTKGTFDCSSYIRIPALGIGQALPQSGTVDIELGIPKTGVLNGTCGMGMYPFEIDFQ